MFWDSQQDDMLDEQWGFSEQTGLGYGDSWSDIAGNALDLFGQGLGLYTGYETFKAAQDAQDATLNQAELEQQPNAITYDITKNSPPTSNNNNLLLLAAAGLAIFVAVSR